MYSLGINIGSSSIKAVLLDEEKIIWHKTLPHEGNFLNTIETILNNQNIPADVKVLATGTEGRYLLNMNSVIESICIEEALSDLEERVDAVISLGGENFIVYTIDEDLKIISEFSGNKCASGTGEFFKQQLGRMNMTIADIKDIPPGSKVSALSSRCSVFMKSDCTHKLNKGEATRYDIVLSLSDVMASKVADFLKKARITAGRVLLAGGVASNRHLIQFLKGKLPDLTIIIPEEAPFFEAYGAALLARKSGSAMPQMNRLFKKHSTGFGRYPSLLSARGRVHYIDSARDKIKKEGEYILGIDGGSTTTKVALIDIESNSIVAEHYGRTHGDPVNALKQCLIEVKKQLTEQIGDAKLNISLAATTGSSREILGVFMETPGIYNEIIAHATGTTYFKPEIDTIFEIGGQDAKYVYMKNGVPIDYAMNEACSAGTGSFLEESASGDLNITDVKKIGEIALTADSPLKFGEHCSAFINSDIRKAIQYGASREDITAGIVTSIVSNYLNRVVGNRTIGQNIVLQGGVAKNSAVPLAFAMLLDKDITVPPDPELLGAFGVALLAKQKYNSGLLAKQSFDLDTIIKSEILYEKEFICRSCDNYCPIRILKVNDHHYMFGGRCNKYANSRKKTEVNETEIFNYIEKRDELMFKECAPPAEKFVKRKDYTVGIPRGFSVYTLYPLYSWFFHTLGIEIKLSDSIDPEGITRVESAYCFPAEIVHGAMESVIKDGADFIFIPHFRDMPSYEKDVHANFCPITQSLPYYMKKAFPEIDEQRILAPVISFKYGLEKALEGFLEMKEQLGVTENEIEKAFNIACKKQEDFFKRYRYMGTEALKRARKSGHPVIALLGRPYNAFTKDANMGIPKKFTSRGYSIIPFDMLPYEDVQIYDNMYWYYGQQDMRAASFLKDEDNIFITFISNFSCAPDSFMLHYVKWLMGTKPFLILELDSHSADAGIDTRIEAFLDIIEGYRTKYSGADEERYDNGLRFINRKGEPIHIFDSENNRRIEIFGNPKVKLLLANMGRLSSELLAASLRGIDINAEAMPLPDIYTLQAARSCMSGKECLPSQLVLGSALKYFQSEKYRKDEKYLLFVPSTTGPCRTGQYYIFYENLFRDLKLENVTVITLDSENSYNELGPGFSRSAWWGIIIADYMKDIETSLRTCALDPAAAIAKYDELWHELVEIAEKDIKNVVPALERIAAEISKIPLKQKVKDTPKVLVVGEIYVRRDDFAVDELIRLMSRKGIIGKVSGISEWIYYTDYVRKLEIMKKYRLLPWYRRYFSNEMKDLIVWIIEEKWKHRVEKQVKDALAATGLIPETPHNMTEIMDNSRKHFVSPELDSEITISSGVASTAMMKDFSGIINISPFACLIGRVIEGLITPWSRERNYPVMSVEIDGAVLPPNIISKLEIFMLNVLRFRQNPNGDDLVDVNESEDASMCRRIIR